MISPEMSGSKRWDLKLRFGGGREDVWEPDQDVYWGRETPGSGATPLRAWLRRRGQGRWRARSDDDADGDVHSRRLENPLAAVQMG